MRLAPPKIVRLPDELRDEAITLMADVFATGAAKQMTPGDALQVAAEFDDQPNPQAEQRSERSNECLPRSETQE